MDKKITVMARPDHSVCLVEGLRKNNDIKYLTFNAKRKSGILSYVLNKGKKINGKFSSLIFFSLFNQISRRIKFINLFKYESTIASLEANLYVDNGFDIVHYWPIYFTDFVKKYKIKNSSCKYIAEVYEANYSEVSDIYQSAYKSNGFSYASISNKNKRYQDLEIADLVLVPSNFVKNTYKNYVKTPIKVVNYGLLGRKLEITENTFNGSMLNLLFIGNASIEKGFDLLVRLSQKNNDICISSIGGISKEISQLDTSNISFLGKMNHEDVLKSIKDFDAIILPSYSDAFSMAVIEGLSKLKPVIISDNCGNSDVVNEWSLGKVFQTGSLSSLELSVHELIAEYDTFRENIIEYVKYEERNPYHVRVQKVYEDIV